MTDRSLPKPVRLGGKIIGHVQRKGNTYCATDRDGKDLGRHRSMPLGQLAVINEAERREIVRQWARQ